MGVKCPWLSSSCYELRVQDNRAWLKKPLPALASPLLTQSPAAHPVSWWGMGVRQGVRTQSEGGWIPRPNFRLALSLPGLLANWVAIGRRVADGEGKAKESRLRSNVPVRTKGKTDLMAGLTMSFSRRRRALSAPSRSYLSLYKERPSLTGTDAN